MAINVRRCYFHSIQPLINYKLRKSHIDEVIARLDFMLDYGYLVPGCELFNILPEEYTEYISPSRNDSVYLSQHILTELGSVGGSYKNGEFSAYSHHIESSPSLVFDEYVTDHKKIEVRSHSLSEEVCIQDRISLNELIALALPYSTPLDVIDTFITWMEDDSFQLDREFFISVIEKNKREVEHILKNPELIIAESYNSIEKFQNCLDSHQVNAPCIRHNGIVFNQEEDYRFIEKNKDKTIELISSIKKR